MSSKSNFRGCDDIAIVNGKLGLLNEWVGLDGEPDYEFLSLDINEIVNLNELFAGENNEDQEQENIDFPRKEDLPF